MKCYEVNGIRVSTGIPVATNQPYPRVILGDGGNKRATWIAIGRRDVTALVGNPTKPCPLRGTQGSPVSECVTSNPARLKEIAEQIAKTPHMKCGCGTEYHERRVHEFGCYETHPDSGEVPAEGRVLDAGAIKLPPKDGKPEAFLIVAPRPWNDDNRVMVLWRVASGYRGDASIKPGEGVVVIASDAAWASGRGAIGETAETLAIMAPGQELRASRSGRRTQNTDGKLTWDGKELHVTFGGSELEAATAEEVQGEYL